ncbi:hypothetical protein QJQ45_004717 [Haematococcus lacustris]|nr:hypothetical protein QJQ45_004717 [Haematococcus lacustris]
MSQFAGSAAAAVVCLVAQLLLLGARAQSAQPTFGTNTATGPFTFDGLEFGFGGLQVRSPSQLLPQVVQNALRRDVTQLVGYDAPDRFFALLYGLPSASPGRIVPAGCVGPIYTLAVNGGNCSTSLTTGEVACTPPSLTLAISPLQCTGFYRIGAAFRGPIVRPVVPLSPIRGGYLGGRPGVFDFGTAVNLTRVQLGFNVNARRVLNDFGVTRWYDYLVSFLGFLFLRASRTLLSTPVNTLLRNANVNVSAPGAAAGGLPGLNASSPPGGVLPGTGGVLRSAGLAQGGLDDGAASDSGLAQSLDWAVQAARSRLQVQRSNSRTAATTALQNPETLLAGVAQSAGAAGFTQFASLLSSLRQAPVNSSAGDGPANSITRQQLGNSQYGAFDAQGMYNPSSPTASQGADSLMAQLTGNPAAGDPSTSDGLVYQQLDSAWRQSQPGQAAVLDDLAGRGLQKGVFALLQGSSADASANANGATGSQVQQPAGTRVSDAPLDAGAAFAGNTSFLDFLNTLPDTPTAAASPL